MNTENTDTDIQLVKKDITQLNKSLNDLSDAIHNLGETTQKLHGISTNVAVQEQILKTNDTRMSSLESTYSKLTSSLDTFRTEVFIEIRRVQDTIAMSVERSQKNQKDIQEKLETRIRNLENFRWYILGISIVLIFLLNWVGPNFLVSEASEFIKQK